MTKDKLKVPDAATAGTPRSTAATGMALPVDQGAADRTAALLREAEALGRRNDLYAEQLRAKQTLSAADLNWLRYYDKQKAHWIEWERARQNGNQ